MARYRWFDDKADKLREAASGPAGITLPGFTQADETPGGHPGFVSEQGAWWDVMVDPEGAPAAMRLAFGRGEVGDNLVEIDSNNIGTEGTQSGMFGIYASEPTFTSEADFVGSAACYADHAAGATATLSVYVTGPHGNPGINGSAHSETAGALATLHVMGTDAQGDALLLLGTVDANLSVLEVHSNGDVEVFTPGGLVLRDTEGGRHRIKVATDGTLSTEVVA